ncbi:MAG: FAD-dependent oxidoreductase [Candidatus Binatia bacterium]
MVVPQSQASTAVVIGSGLAGLLAARVLADFFSAVTIVERDPLPTTVGPRKGVPQGHHAHALLGRGQEILEEFFPGLTQHLLSLGAAQGHGRFFSGGGYHYPIAFGSHSLRVSRPCLETVARAYLLRTAKVHSVENCRVLGLTATEDRQRITGIRFTRHQADAQEEHLAAAFVIDASGRGSRASAWLEDLGYPQPETELVKVDMGYTSRFYRRLPYHLDGDVVANIAASPANKRACGMMAQEGERWIVTLAGYFGDYPPTDEQGFVEFSRSLPVSDVHDVIRTTTPLSDPVAYRFPSNQWRHYEKLTRFPDGFLPIGDAICSFTPIYGQGITVAALEALTLRQCLMAETNNLAQRFFTKTKRVIDTPWSITVGNDKRLAGGQAVPSLKSRFLHWYMAQLHVVARHDPSVSLAFRKVANLYTAPTSLLHPRIVRRVLWGSLRSERMRKTTSPSAVYSQSTPGLWDTAALLQQRRAIEGRETKRRE